MLPARTADPVGGGELADLDVLTSSGATAPPPSADCQGLLRALDLHSAVSVTDCSGRIITVNDTFCRTSGYRREEIVGQEYRIVNSGIQTPAFWRDVWRTIIDGHSWRGEICNRAKSGSLYWVDCVISPVHGSQGKIENYVSIATDVTSAKLTIQKLRASETFLDRTSQIAGIGGWQFDLDTRIVKWSAHMNRLHETAATFQPTLEQGLGFYLPWSRVAIERALKDAERKGTGWDLELQMTTAKGSALWIRSVGTVECLDGNPVRIVGSTQDITARKRIEGLLQESSTERRRAELELLETTSLLRTILDSARDVSMIATDPQLNINVFNLGAERLLGYTSAEVVELDTLISVHDRNELNLRAETLGKLLGRHLDVRETLLAPSMLGVSQDWTYVRKDGTSVAVSAVVSSMVTDEGALLGYLAVARDITEQKQHEESLREAMVRAESANRAKSAFLANMSHEIRTPMNAVIGLSYLLGRTHLSPEQSSLLSSIQAGSDSLLAVISDILDLTKIEAGELIVEQATFSPRIVLRKLCSIMMAQARAKGIALDVEIDENVPEALIGDATRLNQVLSNLVSNAIKFTHYGGVTVSVHRLEDAGKGVILSFVVRDTGIGIAVEAQGRLFAPFAQADASITRRYGGTGLGLSIVKSLVSVMGGRMHLHSKPGLGSEFSVVLEFGVADAAAVKIQESSHPTTVEQALNGARILVVDDSDINLNVTKRILEADGAVVSIADNGLEAVEILRAHPHDFDVVLMDVQMPVLDGHEATRRIRVDLGLVDLPVIALTAGALSSERQRAIAAGMDDFIIKPFDRQTLANSIGRHVEISEERAATPIGDEEPQRSDSADVPWPHIDGIDSVEARVRLCDDVNLFISNIKRLLDEYSDLAAPISALDPEALVGYCARLHKLTGSAGLLAAKSIQELAHDARAAILSGELILAQELLRVLATELDALRESARPILDAGRQREEHEVPVQAEVMPTELGELLGLLHKQSLSAMRRFRLMAPRLRNLLDRESFEIIRGHVDNLRFAAAADALQRLPIDSSASSLI